MWEIRKDKDGVIRDGEFDEEGNYIPYTSKRWTDPPTPVLVSDPVELTEKQKKDAAEFEKMILGEKRERKESK